VCVNPELALIATKVRSRQALRACGGMTGQNAGRLRNGSPTPKIEIAPLAFPRNLRQAQRADANSSDRRATAPRRRPAIATPHLRAARRPSLTCARTVRSASSVARPHGAVDRLRLRREGARFTSSCHAMRKRFFHRVFVNSARSSAVNEVLNRPHECVLRPNFSTVSLAAMGR
jgi:hypothetical protein